MVLVGIAVLVWHFFYVKGSHANDEMLSDGVVLIVADGMVQRASSGSATLLGVCVGKPIVSVLEELLGHGSAEARDAVNRLEMTGEPVNMVVHDRESRAFEMIGEPAGAMIRLVLRDAGFLDNRLKAAAERVEAADTALSRMNWEQETLTGLIAEAPIIAWNRTADGEINWASGQIRTRNSQVMAENAVDLIVARTRLNRQPVLAGQPLKSRIEIVVNEGAEAVSLHVIEIVRSDGGRLGFATDAGTAASAERTLTRFVQTMTETFAHLTVGLAIFDRNQTLALFNPALVSMWQVEPAWLARRPSLRDIVDELRASRRLPDLQDFHTWRSRLLSLFENTEAADYEELWHLADGSNIRVLARPHPHGSLAFIFDDVTERMRLEQRYRHSIDLRRVTLDRLDDGIAVFGANGLLQFVNQSFHKMWATDSESIFAAMHARQLAAVCGDLSLDGSVWDRLLSFVTGEENRREWTDAVATHKGRSLRVRVAPLPDGSTLSVFSDITDQEENARRRSERTVSLRMAVMALESAGEQRPDDDDGDRGGEISALIGQALAGLEPTAAKTERKPGDTGTELLDLARFTDQEHVSLKRAMETVYNLVKPACDRHDVALIMEAVDPAHQLRFNKLTVHQVVFALVGTALDSAVAGQTIVLRTHMSDASWKVIADLSGPEDKPATVADFSPSLTTLRDVVRLGNGSVRVIDYDATTVQIICEFHVAPPSEAETVDTEPQDSATRDNVHLLNRN